MRIQSSLIALLFALGLHATVANANLLHAPEHTDLIAAAHQGDAKAQYDLAVKYMRGEGVEQDKTKAVAWYQKAAEQGLAGAQYNLASIYYHGDGVESDKEQAAHWYKQAAKQGYADAQLNLAVMHAIGEGVDASHKKSLMWFDLATYNGAHPAKEGASIMHNELHRELMYKAKAMAQQCLETNYAECD